MHLSKEIQKRLDILNSAVQLDSTIDGKLPEKYSFYHKSGRSFRAAFAATEKSFSIVLFEKTDKQNYEDCFARAIFTDLERLTSVIDRWANKMEDILEIKKDFGELELYIDFEFRNPNSEIDEAWTKVRNMFFNNTEFWKYPKWNDRYIELLNAAKTHEAFTSYFPFTSHYWLRFSMDKAFKKIWPFVTYIQPTGNGDENPNSFGKFYVSYNDKATDRLFFETAKEALDFYADKLKETKPITWVVH
ncbi:hypothetical protein BH11BAC5_BH11BAC5_49030 [soil metagenome]